MIFTLGNIINCIWSNIRWCRAVKRYPVDVMPLDDCNDFYKFLSDTAARIYDKFNYTKDGMDELGDSMRPPAQCYKDAVEGTLKDDCDGFHAALYHAMAAQGKPTYLIAVLPRNFKSGHCILGGIDPNGNWYAQDYRQTWKSPCRDRKEFVKYLQEIFAKRYGKNASITFIKYNPEKGFRVDFSKKL